MLNATLAEYGVEVVRFNLMSVSVPEEDSSVRKLKDMLADRAKLNVLGQHYQQVRSFDVLDGAAQNDGTAGAFLGMGMGAAFNQTMFGTPGVGVMNVNPPVSPQSGGAASGGLSMPEKIKLLKELGELRSSGILTEEEFQEQKGGPGMSVAMRFRGIRVLAFLLVLGIIYIFQPDAWSDWLFTVTSVAFAGSLASYFFWSVKGDPARSALGYLMFGTPGAHCCLGPCLRAVFS